MNDRVKRWVYALAIFLAPILFGALIINVGGFWAFWLLCYFIMVFLPVLAIAYFIFKYIVQYSAEKVEESHREEGEIFLQELAGKFEVIEEGVWDRSFRKRSRFSRRRPFDRLAVHVLPEWFSFDKEQKEKTVREIAEALQEWLRKNNLEMKNHTLRVDLYSDLSKRSSLVGKYENGKVILF